MKSIRLLVLFLCAVSLHGQQQQPAQSGAAVAAGQADSGLGLIPEPKKVTKGEGQFVIDRNTRIVIGGPEFRKAAETIADEIALWTGARPRISAGRGGSRTIALVQADKGTIPTDVKYPEQAYHLEAARNGVVIRGMTAQGVFYGAQTLRQLIRPFPFDVELRRRMSSNPVPAVPAVNIVDWPTMEWRGVHDDINRGPIPTLDYMKKQIRLLASYKINMFSLYIEHVFDFAKHPLIAPKEAGLNAAQIRELVAYAKEYYVTLLPEQQAFGHLHHVLKIEKYSELAETPHGHVLAPVNEKSYALIKDFYDEMAPLFPGPFFHIGADETWELGRGQSKEHADKVGLGKVYLEHLKKVREIMQPHNKRLMFWADIAEHYPDLVKEVLSKDMIAVAWSYGPAATFDNKLKPFADAGLTLMVAPGANNWNRIVPNLDAAFINISNFVRDGQKYGAIGMLNTTWDDNGEALFEMTWPAMVFGAGCAWEPAPCSADDFKKKYDWAFYRNAENTALMEGIMSLSSTHEIMRKAGLGGAMDDHFWADPFSELVARNIKKAEPSARELRLAAENGLELIYRNRARAKANAETLDTMAFAGLRLDALGMKIQFAGEMSRYYWEAFSNMGDRPRATRALREISSINARLQDMRDASARLRALYAEAWLRENRPYWLGSVLARYDLLTATYQKKIGELGLAQQQYREDGALPTPQQMGFHIRPEPPAPNPAR